MKDLLGKIEKLEHLGFKYAQDKELEASDKALVLKKLESIFSKADSSYHPSLKKIWPFYTFEAESIDSQLAITHWFLELTSNKNAQELLSVYIYADQESTVFSRNKVFNNLKYFYEKSNFDFNRVFKYVADIADKLVKEELPVSLDKILREMVLFHKKYGRMNANRVFASLRNQKVDFNLFKGSLNNMLREYLYIKPPSFSDENLKNSFPFLGHWPKKLKSRESYYDFNSSVVKWIHSLDDTGKTLFKELVELKGHCAKRSRKLKASYRKYCIENNFVYAL